MRVDRLRIRLETQDLDYRDVPVLTVAQKFYVAF